MKIEVSRRNAINLKLFLEGLGYSCVFNLTPNRDVVELITKEDNEFLSDIREYMINKGFIPYHYTISPTNKGELHKGSVGVRAVATQINEFNNVSGKFRLILFEGENNFLWKTYSEVEIPKGIVNVSGRYVATITGKGGQIINLINYVRIKSVQ